VLVLPAVVGLSTRLASALPPDVEAVSSTRPASQPVVQRDGPNVPQRRRIAIAPLKNLRSQKDIDWIGTAAAEMLATKLAGVPGLAAVERAQIKQVIEEHSFQQLDLSDPKTAVKLGGFVGAERMLIGTYVQDGSTILFNVRVVDVKSGLILTTAALKTSRDNLLEAFFQLADAVIRSFNKKVVVVRERPEVTEAAEEEHIRLTEAQRKRLRDWRTARPTETITHLRTRGMALARDGCFEQALLKFRQAAMLSPKNNDIACSVRLLSEYVLLKGRMTAERADEFDRAVVRAKRCLMVELHLEDPANSDLAERLREKLKEAVSNHNDIGSVSDLWEVSAEKAEKLREKTLTAMDKSTETIRKVLEILKDDKSVYAETFGKLVESFVEQKKAYYQAWAGVDLETPAERRQAAGKLWAMEYDMAEALGDLEAMTSKNPWRIALSQAWLAKELCDDADSVTQQDWCRSVAGLVGIRAKQAVEKGDWSEALGAYSGLSKLYPGDVKLRREVKIARRRARVLNMYGNKHIEDEGDQSDEEDGMFWKEMVAGADADLVEKVIAQLNKHVSPVDYREMANGALGAVKILAEMPKAPAIFTKLKDKEPANSELEAWKILAGIPEAAASFPKLKDKTKRDDFLKAIDARLAEIAGRERVAQIDLKLALEGVLSASEKTVEIPIDVLAVEFTGGMLDGLDQFSSMVWPYDVQEFQKHIRGSFIGVGIQIRKEPKEPLRVVTPLDDTPASRAGIKRGDLIVAVDERETKDLHISRLIKMIMGEPNTKVVLRIRREGRLKPFKVEIIRQQIKIETVKGWRRGGGGKWDYMLDRSRRVGYVRVTQFSDKTTADLRKALESLRKAGVKSLVLDLRSNPGGRLDSAIEIADEFLAAGRIVSTGRSAKKLLASWSAGRKGNYQEGNLVVLINKHSASAAEIVSGAIQDLHRGILIGQRSFGKGSVQKVYHLRVARVGGKTRPVASLKLTTAYYYLPSQRRLHRKPGATTWGVDPGIWVPLTPRQINHWLDIRRKTDLLQENNPDQLADELDEQIEADLQLNTALLLLRLMELQETRAGAMRKAA
jgi:carboxyl-terminal processing protease